jgi:hypothetical protein
MSTGGAHFNGHCGMSAGMILDKSAQTTDYLNIFDRSFQAFLFGKALCQKKHCKHHRLTRFQQQTLKHLEMAERLAEICGDFIPPPPNPERRYLSYRV